MCRAGTARTTDRKARRDGTFGGVLRIGPLCKSIRQTLVRSVAERLRNTQPRHARRRVACAPCPSAGPPRTTDPRPNEERLRDIKNTSRPRAANCRPRARAPRRRRDTMGRRGGSSATLRMSPSTHTRTHNLEMNAGRRGNASGGAHTCACVGSLRPCGSIPSNHMHGAERARRRVCSVDLDDVLERRALEGVL